MSRVRTMGQMRELLWQLLINSKREQDVRISVRINRLCAAPRYLHIYLYSGIYILV